MGSGDPLNSISSGSVLRIVFSGPVGSVHRIYYSTLPQPSSIGVLQLSLGNNFSDVRVGPTVTIGPSGTTTISKTITVTGRAIAFYAQSINLSGGASPQFDVSNLQSVVLRP